MKAIGCSSPLPIDHPDCLQDITLPLPTVSGHDLLVKVAAIAVNPVDYKMRQVAPSEQGAYKVLGWDAVGEVVAVGENVTQFSVGDEVFYAGDVTRQGCNAEYQCVDERIVGFKPKSLTAAEAAALPLTAITAWELLFDHLMIQKISAGDVSKTGENLLVVGAAGGVGSILLQLAKLMTGARVIATASRERSKHWVEQRGADYVVDHSQPLKPQVEALDIGQITHVASLNSTSRYFESYTEMLAPFGKIGMIDDPKGIDTTLMKPKSLSLHIEFMFARAMFQAADMIEQSRLLNRVAQLVDEGQLQTTLGKNLGIINAENLKAAHAELEAGTAIGKIVLEGF